MEANAHVLDHDRAEMVVTECPDRATWLRLRKQMITSTDVAGLSGVSRFSTPLSVWEDKVREDGDEPEATESMLLGRTLQRSVALAYAMLRQRRDGQPIYVSDVPETTLHLHASRAYHGTSLDAWQSMGSLDARQEILEVKTTATYPDEPYSEWLTQVQWQMYVTGSRMATIAALCGGSEVRWWDVERDEEAIGALREIADAWMHTYWLPRVPPPSDGSEPSRVAVRRIFGHSTPGREVSLTIDDLNDVVLLRELKARVVEAEQAAGAVEDKLKMRMQDAELAYLPNGGKIVWRTTARAAYAVPATTVRSFRIYDPPAPKKRR